MVSISITFLPLGTTLIQDLPGILQLSFPLLFNFSIVFYMKTEDQIKVTLSINILFYRNFLD